MSSHKMSVAARKSARARAMIRQNGLCAGCGLKLVNKNHRPNSATLDHIVPVSSHGGNKDSNLQVMCRPCNLSKGGSVFENQVRSL